jgi:hypothetical protein
MSPSVEIIAMARAAAAKHALDPALVCAVVEQESAWDAHAIRYEPSFRTRYVAPLGLPPKEGPPGRRLVEPGGTEEIARSISWGLMQVMGQVAREHGFQGKFLSALCEPEAGLDIGCAVLAAKFAAAATLRAASGAVEGQGFLALSEVEGSPAENDGRVAPSDLPGSPCRRPGSPSLLPQAVAQALAPEQQKSAAQRQEQGIAAGEIARALQLWNGGANPDYASQVLARLPHYR